nr:spenito [Cucujiformia]
TGNAFAFVRFHTLDMAHRAKVELSGQYIGKFQCKIGYGKATPTTRIWVGGLGSWTSVPQLEREFDRFGAIKKIDYVKGDSQAYILYDSIDAAQAAVKEMRGFPLGGPERRLRTDFSDVALSSGPQYRAKPGYDDAGAPSGGPDYRRDYDYEYEYDNKYRGRYAGERRNDDDWPGRRNPDDYEHRRGRRSGSRGAVGERSRSRSPRRSPDSDSDGGSRRAGLLASSRTLPEVARKCTTIWQGALILKNSLFPAKFHLMDGDTDIIDCLMRDEDGKHQLRITQRLRLDPPKLDDV